MIGLVTFVVILLTSITIALIVIPDARVILKNTMWARLGTCSLVILLPMLLVLIWASAAGKSYPSYNRNLDDINRTSNLPLEQVVESGSEVISSDTTSSNVQGSGLKTVLGFNSSQHETTLTTTARPFKLRIRRPKHHRQMRERKRNRRLVPFNGVKAISFSLNVDYLVFPDEDLMKFSLPPSLITSAVPSVLDSESVLSNSFIEDENASIQLVTRSEHSPIAKRSARFVDSNSFQSNNLLSTTQHPETDIPILQAPTTQQLIPLEFTSASTPVGITSATSVDEYLIETVIDDSVAVVDCPQVNY